MNKITLVISICALAISLIVVGLSVHQLVLVDQQINVDFVFTKPAGWIDTDNGMVYHEAYNITEALDQPLHKCMYYDDQHGMKQTTEWHTDTCPNIWKWN